ncbi:hypothetical protein WN943_022302 [Citrus x changshan-huyou]
MSARSSSGENEIAGGDAEKENVIKVFKDNGLENCLGGDASDTEEVFRICRVFGVDQIVNAMKAFVPSGRVDLLKAFLKIFLKTTKRIADVYVAGGSRSLQLNSKQPDTEGFFLNAIPGKIHPKLCEKHYKPCNIASFWKANAMTVGTQWASDLQAQNLSTPVPRNLGMLLTNSHSCEFLQVVAACSSGDRSWLPELHSMDWHLMVLVLKT